jgi:hypothetical protein
MESSINNILSKAESLRKSNMHRHNYINIPLLNYTDIAEKENCNFLNFEPSLTHKLVNKKLEYSPRYIYFSEFTLFYNLEYINVAISKIDIEGQKCNVSNIFFGKTSVLDSAFEKYYLTNYVYRKNLIFNNPEEETNFKEKIKSSIYVNNQNCDSFYSKDLIFTNSIKIPYSQKFTKSFSIAVANTKIKSDNILSSIVDKPNDLEERSNSLVRILNQSEEVKADALILPEVSFPFQYLFQIADEARRKQRLIIAGLEHLRIKDVCYNFIATCLPLEYNGIKDVAVVLRLKNHYSPGEQKTILEKGKIIPISKPATYNLFEWRDLHFSVYNCYELADIIHRSVFRSKVDLLFASEYNKDVNYFSNIVESVTRDIHCYFVQANTSNFGDSRITAPTKSDSKDILRLKGGENDVVLLGKINIDELRVFQETRLLGQDKSKFKNTPPNYIHKEAEKRLKRK